MDSLYSRMKPYLGDEERLMDRMAGRLDLWEECVKLFPREEIIEAMDRALAVEDFTGLYSEVHRLKGNLANFGFDALALEAAAVLHAIKEKNMTQIRERYQSLRESYLQIIERIGDAK
ncbi:MAG: Hpt domain-containing protein [Lachnospiraceae bacterium]|nr:Hpt domain-containing protein [Lachnospiraceae bacterium]